MSLPDFTDQHTVNLHVIEALGEIKADVATVKTSQDIYIKGLDATNVRVNGLADSQHKIEKKIVYYSGVGVGIGGALGAFGKIMLTKLGIHI
jgi:hypothetical protein